MDQKGRELIMREFRSGSSRVLITTDLLARGAPLLPRSTLRPCCCEALAALGQGFRVLSEKSPGVRFSRVDCEPRTLAQSPGWMLASARESALCFRLSRPLPVSRGSRLDRSLHFCTEALGSCPAVRLRRAFFFGGQASTCSRCRSSSTTTFPPFGSPPPRHPFPPISSCSSRQIRTK
jgi:hypothetical protein